MTFKKRDKHVEYTDRTKIHIKLLKNSCHHRKCEHFTPDAFSDIKKNTSRSRQVIYSSGTIIIGSVVVVTVW